jgi:outer membrane protein
LTRCRRVFAEYSVALPLIGAAPPLITLRSTLIAIGTYTDVINDETAVNQARLEMEDAHANVFTAAAAAALALPTGTILPQR